MKVLRIFIICTSVAAALSGCGGGGGGSAPATSSGSSSNSTSTTTSNTITSTPPIAPGAPSTTANQVPIVAAGQAFGTLNRLYVDVTVCAPGTATCQTVHDVVVDSGSFGLRLLASALSPTVLNALPVTPAGSGTLNECSMFAGGNMWGSVRTADINMAGESAKSTPVQVVDDGLAPVPSACSSSGTIMSSSSGLGGNGLIGVGLLHQDCGLYCVQTVSNPYYYTCTGAACTETSVQIAQQVVNPISMFASDNNGVLLSLPVVPPQGAASAAGTMTFGVDTQANNTLASTGAATYTLSPTNPTVNAVYKGTTLPAFFDTGSPMNYFSDSSIPLCSQDSMFCPQSDLSLSTEITGVNGATTSIPFVVGNGTNLLSQSVPETVFSTLAASSGSNAMLSGNFDFGLPFFFGRTVGFVFNGSASRSTVGPAVSF